MVKNARILKMMENKVKSFYRSRAKKMNLKLNRTTIVKKKKEKTSIVKQVHIHLFKLILIDLIFNQIS